MLIQNLSLPNATLSCRGVELHTDERGVVEVSDTVGEFLTSTRGWSQFSGVQEADVQAARVRVVQAEAGVKQAEAVLARAKKDLDAVLRTAKKDQEAVTRSAPKAAIPEKPKAEPKPKVPKPAPAKEPETEEPAAELESEDKDDEDDEDAGEDGKGVAQVPDYSTSTARELYDFLRTEEVAVPDEAIGHKPALWKIIKANFDIE